MTRNQPPSSSAASLPGLAVYAPRRHRKGVTSTVVAPDPVATADAAAPATAVISSACRKTVMLELATLCRLQVVAHKNDTATVTGTVSDCRVLVDRLSGMRWLYSYMISIDKDVP